MPISGIPSLITSAADQNKSSRCRLKAAQPNLSKIFQKLPTTATTASLIIFVTATAFIIIVDAQSFSNGAAAAGGGSGNIFSDMLFGGIDPGFGANVGVGEGIMGGGGAAAAGGGAATAGEFQMQAAHMLSQVALFNSISSLLNPPDIAQQQQQPAAMPIMQPPMAAPAPAPNPMAPPRVTFGYESDIFGPNMGCTKMCTATWECPRDAEWVPLSVCRMLMGIPTCRCISRGPVPMVKCCVPRAG